MNLSIHWLGQVDWATKNRNCREQNFWLPQPCMAAFGVTAAVKNSLSLSLTDVKNFTTNYENNSKLQSLLIWFDVYMRQIFQRTLQSKWKSKSCVDLGTHDLFSRWICKNSGKICGFEIFDREFFHAESCCRSYISVYILKGVICRDICPENELKCFARVAFYDILTVVQKCFVLTKKKGYYK